MKELWLASVATVLGCAIIEPISVQAAIVTYDFQVDLRKGTLYQNYFENNELDPDCPGGVSFYCPIPANETTLGALFGVVGEGFFTFDDTVEPGAFDVIPLTSLSFSFDGRSFTLADAYSNFSEPGFSDSYFWGLGIDDFSISGDGPPPGDLLTRSLRKFLIEQSEFYFDFADIAGTFDFYCEGCVTYTLRKNTLSSIPEPTSVFSLLALGIMGIGSTVYRASDKDEIS